MAAYLLMCVSDSEMFDEHKPRLFSFQNERGYFKMFICVLDENVAGFASNTDYSIKIF